MTHFLAVWQCTFLGQRGPMSEARAAARRAAARWTAALVFALAPLAGAGCQSGQAPEPDASIPASPAVKASGTAEPAAASAGLDSAQVAGVLARAEDLPRLRSLLVARRGSLLVERYYHGARASEPVNIKSASKSLLSALVGCAIAEGHLRGPEQSVAPFFEDYLGAEVDPRKREITVGHLLSMQAGLESTSGAGYGAWVQSANWARYAVERPMVATPGGRMIYSTGSSHLLSAVLTQATGESTWRYAQGCLAGPLNIDLPRWRQDPQGIYFGGNEMRLTPRALVRLGTLYLGGGVFEGQRVLPAAWVRRSLEPRARSPWSGHRYGYGWWLKEAHGYRVFFAWGYGGQYVFVVPELALVVAMTSDPAPEDRSGAHLDALHALLDDGLIPAAVAGAG